MNRALRVGLVVMLVPLKSFASAGSDIEYALDGCKNGSLDQYVEYRDKAYAQDASIKDSSELHAGYVTSEGIKKCDGEVLNMKKAAAAWAANGLPEAAADDFDSVHCPAGKYDPDHYTAGQDSAANTKLAEALSEWKSEIKKFYAAHPGSEGKLFKKTDVRTVGQFDKECQASITANVTALNAWGKGVNAQTKKVVDEVIARQKAAEARDAALVADIEKRISGEKLAIFQREGVPSQLVPNSGSDAKAIASASTWIYQTGTDQTATIVGSGGRQATIRGPTKWCTKTYVFKGNALSRKSSKNCD